MAGRRLVGSETSAEKVKQIVGLPFYMGWPVENVLAWQTFQSMALAAHAAHKFDLSLSWSVQPPEKRMVAVKTLRGMCLQAARLQFIRELMAADVLEWRLRQEHKMLRQQYQDARIRANGGLGRTVSIPPPREAPVVVKQEEHSIKRVMAAPSGLPYDPVRDLN